MLGLGNEDRPEDRAIQRHEDAARAYDRKVDELLRDINVLYDIIDEQRKEIERLKESSEG
jgi:predicted RNase H-like nuclease (RuvC/YqgF family)